MRVLGRANWWAPAPLSRLHRRAALGEAGEHGNEADATPVGDTRGPEPALRGTAVDGSYCPEGSPAPKSFLQSPQTRIR
jgi:hypothetical protein